MRYTTRINNRKCIEWGINAGQAALFDLLNECAGWAKPMVINGEVFYWVSRQLVIEELPLFFSKPDTAYRAMKALEEKGLIEYQRSAGFELVRITSKGATWNSHDAVEDDSSEKNPTTRKNFREVGKISEDSEKNPNSSEKFPSGSEKNPNSSEKFPSNKYINQPTNQGTNPGVCAGAARNWWKYRNGKAMSDEAWERHCQQAEAAGVDVQTAAKFAAGKGWQGFYAASYLREVAETEQARQMRDGMATPKGRVFDERGQVVAGSGGMPAGFGGAPKGGSAISRGLAILDSFIQDED